MRFYKSSENIQKKEGAPDRLSHEELCFGEFETWKCIDLHAQLHFKSLDVETIENTLSESDLF